jgi:hypothetical protein
MRKDSIDIEIREIALWLREMKVNWTIYNIQIGINSHDIW